MLTFSFVGKAYRQGLDQIEEALGVVPGPNGIVMACFLNGPPLEITGIMNEVLEPKLPKVDSDKPGPRKRVFQDPSDARKDISLYMSVAIVVLLITHIMFVE